MKSKAALSILLMVNLFSARGQSTTVTEKNIVEISGDNLMMDYLKEGKNKYLVYVENANNAVINMSIWEREISFSEKNNEETIVIKQHWKNQDHTKTKKIYSINKRADFYPIFHLVEKGTGIKDAFDFKENLIKGTDSIDLNSKKDFSLKLEVPTFNFELDMETFQCLPYEKNTVFRINFYHPGGSKAPMFYDYEVIGEKVLDIVSAKKVDCWLLRVKYGEGNDTVFWISKKTREVLKVVEKWGPITAYKVKFNNNN